MMRPDVIKFLRKEAHKMYLGLNYQQRSLTTEDQIYRGLKAAWKDGAKLKKDARETGRGMPLRFQDMTGEQKQAFQDKISDARLHR